MSNPQALIEAGWRSHQAGDLGRAETLYRQALEVHPGQADVWCLLGGVRLALGDVADATEHFRQAAQLNPNHAAAHDNLGVALARQNRLVEAEASFRVAQRLKPDSGETLGNLAVVLEKLNRVDEAITTLRQAVLLRPSAAELHYRLGTALVRQGAFAEAEGCYRTALRLKPDYAAAHDSLGVALGKQGRLDEAIVAHREALHFQPNTARIHNNIGLVLSRQGKLEEALASFREAIRLQPNHAEAHNNLGVTLGELGRPAEAAAAYREAVRHKPDYSIAHSNLGTALGALGQYEAALPCFDEALRLQPDNAEAHLNRGSVLEQLGQVHEALACYEEALARKPNDPEAHHNRAIAWLLLGDYDRGWDEYEWRWQTKMFTPQPFRQPLWDGSPLDGRTILLHTEQGLGDTFQFIRYAPMVKARGGRVLLGCPGVLHPDPVELPGIDALVAEMNDPSGFDVHAPLLSLPRIFGTRKHNIPAEIPYFSARPDLLEKWGEELQPIRGFKVGLIWRGSPKYKGDRHRSFSLRDLLPLARVPGVRFLSLQKGAGVEEIQELAGQMDVLDLGSRLDETTGAFLDTAAVMKHLDLVISCNTSAAHLAGALGVPFWVALPLHSEWRWLLDRADSPWYPTARLFRQSKLGEWGDVFDQMAQALKQELAADKRG